MSASVSTGGIEVVPTGAGLGAEIRGVDLSQPLSDEQKGVIKQAYLDHLAIFIRGQKLTDRQLVDFSAYFGPVLKEERLAGTNRELGTDLPEYIDIISNVKVDGKTVGVAGTGELQWHTDTLPLPNSALILHAWEAPESGSATKFANGYAAYEALSDEVKARIDGRILLHSRIADLQGDVPHYDRDFSNCVGPWFPLVRVHGETGRKGLFLGREGQGHIIGFSSEESNNLLRQLWEHQVKPEFRWDHNWQTGDVLVWDNRCTVHSRGHFEGRRVLHRTTCGGEWPMGVAA